MPNFMIKADVTVTYLYDAEADTIEDAIAAIEEGDNDDCMEHDSTLPTVTEYTIEGQMGWNAVADHGDAATPPYDHPAIAAARGAIDSLMTQIEQMRGMFDDDDGAIQAALDDGEAALTMLEAPDTDPLLHRAHSAVNAVANLHVNYGALATVMPADADWLAATAARDEVFTHHPDRCPSDHWNRGDDICEDCGKNLNE